MYIIYIPWITPMMVAQLRLFQALICKSMWPLHSRLGERSRCRWNHWFECCWGHPARVFWGLNTCWLVVWNIWLIFPYIGNVIIQLTFQRGGSTTNQSLLGCRLELQPEYGDILKWWPCRISSKSGISLDIRSLEAVQGTGQHSRSGPVVKSAWNIYWHWNMWW